MIVIRLFLWLIIIGIFASPVVAWYGLDDTPLVTKGPEVGVKDINSAKAFLEQYDRREDHHDQGQSAPDQHGAGSSAGGSTFPEGANRAEPFRIAGSRHGFPTDPRQSIRQLRKHPDAG